MKVLIIGGTRYFGKRLANNLIKAGHEVTVMSRGNTEFKLSGPYEHLLCDRNNSSQMAEALDGLTFDAVVDQVCMNQEQMKSALTVLRDKTKHYILTSTLSVYDLGANLKEEVVDPLSFTDRLATNPIEEYALGKRGAEHALVTASPFKVAIARFPLVLGEDDYTKRFELIVDSVKRGQPMYFENLTAKFSLIHSEDAARGLQFIIERGLEGIYNLAAPEAWEIGQILAAISEQVNRPYLLSTDAKDATPISIPSDYVLNCDKALSLGFPLRAVSDWMPSLIHSLL